MKRKSKTIGYLLAFFLGGLGAHLFYYGKYLRGFIYLIFSWTYVPIFLGWIDMFFIKKWNESNDSLNYQTKQLVKTETQSILKKQIGTFYNEEDIMLPKYKHLKTPDSILKSLQEITKPRKSKGHDVGEIRVEIAYSHSGADFIKDSLKFANRREEKCKEIPLQAYWTTFSNLNDKQLKWYFYWREQVLNGNYIEVDLSYIYLFVYELLNYSFNPNSAFNISALVRVYENYVKMHPNLNNHLPRWIQNMLDELEEEELAKEWNQKENIPTIYKLINEEEKPLNRISISYWKPYIRNYRETKFFIDNKNKIYKIFKESTILLEDYYHSQNKSIKETWFEKRRIRNVEHLFQSAVIGRGNAPVHVYRTYVQPTDIFYNEITTLFRISENVARLINGEKREIKVDENILPDDFKDALLERFSDDAKKINERFKVVQKRDEQIMGSSIPKGQEEQIKEQNVIEFNDENINRLNNESKELQEVFNQIESGKIEDENEKKQLSYNMSKSGIPEPNQEKESKAVDEPIESYFENSNGDEEGFINSLSVEEKEFLSLFDNGGYLQDDASSFAKKNGKMLGLFLSELNEKANEYLGDNIVEPEGDMIILYEEFSSIVKMMKGA